MFELVGKIVIICYQTIKKEKQKNRRPKKNFIIVIFEFSLLWFYSISTIVGDLMPDPHYTYILNIYDLVGLGFMAYQPL